jgi:hypothetical protein
MRRLSRIIVVTALVAAAATAARVARGTASTAAPAAQNYFGWTSKGMPVQLDIHGKVLSKQSFIDGRLWSTCPATMHHCLKKRWSSDIISLLRYAKIPMTGNRITYHRAQGGSEWWLVATRTQGGRVISGWVRQSNHWAGYAPSDSGKIHFRTTLWASSAGTKWTGQTSDGQPLTMSVGYRSVLADLPFSVTQLSRSLTCNDPGGASSTHQITIASLKGEMSNLYWRGGRKYQFPAHTRPEKPASGSVTTSDGLSVTATVTVDRLGPQGKALIATGKLRLEATATGTSSLQCAPLATTFVLRPQ